MSFYLTAQPEFFPPFKFGRATLYNALITWDKIGLIEVTPVSLMFWRQFDDSIKVGRHPWLQGPEPTRAGLGK